MDLNRRRAWAVQAQSEGKKIDEIASALAVTVPRVRQMLRDAERISTLPAWVSGLSLATARIVVARGFCDKNDVRSALDRGARVDRIGPSRQAELREWIAGETSVTTAQ